MKEWSRFENEVEKTNDWYRRKGLGVVSKIPNGTKTFNKNGQPITILTDKTGCDFQGHLKGVPIAFDCKSTSNKTAFPLKTHNKPMVKPHQKKYLKDFKKTGGLAYLLIQFNPVKRVFLVDIDQYLAIEQESLDAGKKSIPISKFEGMEVERRLYFHDYAKLIGELK